MYNPIKVTQAPTQDGAIRSQKFSFRNIAASWETVAAPDTGSDLHVSAHTEVGWLSLVVREQGMKSRKTTMVTLDAEQVAELRSLLSHIAPTPAT